MFQELGAGAFGTAYVGHFRASGMQCAAPRAKSAWGGRLLSEREENLKPSSAKGHSVRLVWR